MFKSKRKALGQQDFIMVIVTISKVAHNQHLLVQRQIRALWEICRVNKGTRTTSPTSGVFVVNFEEISHILLVFPLHFSLSPSKCWPG